MFTDSEVVLLLECTDLYRENVFAPFSFDLGLALFESCSRKLKTITALTFFSKQEFTFLSFAVNFEISFFENSGAPAPDSLYDLFLKIQKLNPAV